MMMNAAPPDPRRRPRSLFLIAAVALVALLVAACSGAAPSGQGVVSLEDPSASPDPSASATASQDPEEQMLAFQRCMRDHGVDVQVTMADPNATGGKVGVNIQTGPGPSAANGGRAQPGTAPDEQKLKAADDACHSLLPNGGQGDPSRTMDPQLQDQLLAFAQCMRDHGIDFPDPQFDGNRVTIGSNAGGRDNMPDPNSPQFKAATDACGKDLPGGAPFKINSDSGSSSGSAPDATTDSSASGTLP